MNKMIKQIQEINKKAFMFVKNQEYKIKGYFFHKKMVKHIAKFRKNNNDWITEFEHIQSSKVPNRMMLNMYLREKYNDVYPRFIEIAEYLEDGNQLAVNFLEMICTGDHITGAPLKGTFEGADICNFTNMEGKTFTYIHRLLPFDYYSFYKTNLMIKLAEEEGITDKHEIAKRFL